MSDLLLAKGHAPCLVVEASGLDGLFALSLDRHQQALLVWHADGTSTPLGQFDGEDWHILRTAARVLAIGLEGERLARGWWLDLAGDAPRTPASSADMARAGRMITASAFSVLQLAPLPLRS